MLVADFMFRETRDRFVFTNKFYKEDQLGSLSTPETLVHTNYGGVLSLEE